MSDEQHSAIYVGRVSHRRFAPTRHALSYRLFMVYLDLEELPEVLDALPGWSARGRALAEFRRSDHLGSASESLRESVESLLVERGVRPPGGPIRLLTHLRYAGFVFNPVSFYYCFPRDSDSSAPEVIVAEVDNTPWGERHLYVLPACHGRPDGAQGGRSWEFDKAFHVSPFMPMQQRYRWRFGVPGERLEVTMANLPGDASDGDGPRRCFEAHLRLERRPLDASHATRALVGYPLMTAKVFAAIYWNALQLWLKRTPFHPHPHGNNRQHRDIESSQGASA
ncbi:MAG: DUF1365 domain-containing protein [Myxococcales bacterium]|nr:DUF1365 domain-containing protein [Myxococcales bacterium]